jgi:hypothetical protein
MGCSVGYVDTNIPNMGFSADVNRRCCSYDHSIPRRPDMIGIDFQTNTALLLRIDDQRRSHTAYCFGKRATGSAMK